MSDLFEQNIYKNGIDCAFEKYPWLLGDLKQSIVADADINHYYAISSKNNDAWRFLSMEKNDARMKNEMWRPVKRDGFDGVFASNMGRIMWNGRILHLREKNCPNADLTRDLFINLLHNNHVSGYLFADGLSKDVFVHQLVALAWLAPRNINGTIHVHHISNDGYDNRPENLILLTETEHFEKLGHKKHSDPKYFPGKYDWNAKCDG